MVWYCDAMFELNFSNATIQKTTNFAVRESPFNPFVSFNSTNPFRNSPYPTPEPATEQSFVASTPQVAGARPRPHVLFPHPSPTSPHVSICLTSHRQYLTYPSTNAPKEKTLYDVTLKRHSGSLWPNGIYHCKVNLTLLKVMYAFFKQSWIY